MTSSTSSLEPVAPQDAPEFIEMRGISKRFGGVRALIDVSFSIRSGGNPLPRRGERLRQEHVDQDPLWRARA